MQTINLNRKFMKIWQTTYNTAKWNMETLMKRELDAQNTQTTVINRNETVKAYVDPNRNAVVGPKYIIRCPQCKKFVGSVQKVNVTTHNNMTMVCPHCDLESDKWVVITLKKGFVVTSTDFVVSEYQIENHIYKDVILQFLEDHKSKKFEVCHEQAIECCTAYLKTGEAIDVEICED